MDEPTTSSEEISLEETVDDADDLDLIAAPSPSDDAEQANA